MRTQQLSPRPVSRFARLSHDTEPPLPVGSQAPMHRARPRPAAPGPNELPGENSHALTPSFGPPLRLLPFSYS